ncbi:mitochondrial distribution and morphology family 33, partial [Leucogyrophana mollusca]
YDLEKVKERLREWSAVASAVVRNRADEFTVKTSSTFSQLGSHLNRVTGYEEIEVLKKQVVEQEARIKSTRQAAREAKGAHDEAVVQRSVSQREVNDLLQRKSSWTDADVSRFTSLVRADHLYEQEEARAKAHVAETEDSVDREFSALMRAILARYHEEQVWSDKIRSASTYGSLAVLGINLVVFVMAIVVVEPWKRRRLAQTFERKVEEMGAENRAVVDGGTARLEERIEQQEKLLAGILN